MSSMLAQEPSIPDVLTLIASRDEATVGLRALAAETGGRAGRRYRELAERIERGELPKLVGETAPATSSVAALARFELLQRRRNEARGNLIAVCLLGWFYLVAALAVGLFLIQTAVPLAVMMDQDFVSNSQSSSQYGESLTFYSSVYVGGLVASVVAGGLFLLRLWRRSPAWNEWLWDRVPGIGSTLRAIEVAEMVESIYQSLVAGQDYVTALGVAGQTATSTRLRRWLRHSRERLQAGETLHGVVRDLPIRGEFFSGVIGSLASLHTPSSVVDLWQETSLRMHAMVFRRSVRVQTVMAPTLIVLAMLVACFAFTQSVGMLYAILQMLTWLI